MIDGFSVDVEAEELIRALDELGDFAQPYINEASEESAESAADEMRSRLSRQLGPNATGKTLAGIGVEPAEDGNGYIIKAERDPFPMLPKWIDKGTKKGKPRSSRQPARPFFDVSLELEQGPHMRRITAAIGRAIADKELGDG